MHDTQSSFYFIFCYINHKLYKLCENYIHEGQEGENVKAHYEFGNDSMKVCFKHKTRMKVDHKIKILELFSCVFIT
jgi:hypothetical protein